MAKILDFTAAFDRARADRRVDMRRLLATVWDDALASADPLGWFNDLPTAPEDGELCRVDGTLLVRLADGFDVAELDFGSSDIVASWTDSENVA